jgi:hypothetical protein
LFEKFLALFLFPKSDYRPISILPVLAKAFENVMYEQMVNYVDRNGLISSFQSGFRPGYSKATDIARVSDDIRPNMESNQATILVLLDFSKAVDIVCHSFLSCVSATAFILRRRHLFFLIFFLGIKKLHVHSKTFGGNFSS